MLKAKVYIDGDQNDIEIYIGEDVNTIGLYVIAVILALTEP